MKSCKHITSGPVTLVCYVCYKSTNSMFPFLLIWVQTHVPFLVQQSYCCHWCSIMYLFPSFRTFMSSANKLSFPSSSSLAKQNTNSYCDKMSSKYHTILFLVRIHGYYDHNLKAESYNKSQWWQDACLSKMAFCQPGFKYLFSVELNLQKTVIIISVLRGVTKVIMSEFKMCKNYNFSS